MKILWMILLPLLLTAEPPSVEQLFNIQTIKVKKDPIKDMKFKSRFVQPKS